MYKLRNKVIGRIIVFLWCCIGLVAMADDASIDVDNLLKVMGEKQGLILHLGAGQKKSAGMTALLAQKSGLPVHGLALDDDALARTQKAILAMNMSGYAMVEKLQEKSLPYNADLATVVVVEDMAMLTSRGISNDEIMRVVAPYGRLCVKDNNKWTVVIKPRSKKMDEWTHPHHGADGSLVSTDSAISFPLRLRWIAGTPTMRGGFGACASTRAVVFAGGRCFAVSVDDPGDPSSKKQTAFLLARDAYSGFPLWKFDCEVGYDKNKLEWRNVWPLVATDSRVYTARTNNLFFLNARSGKVEVTCPTKYQTRRLLLSGKYLVAASWEKKVLSNPKDGFEGDRFRTTWWPGNVGEVEVFDSETGASIWKSPLTALTIAASEDTLYVLTNEGNPPI
ncbi:MAG: hypothetical protein KAI74_04320, partial [Kiritimatiellae bacterium]|nr:hypothetical protein [Kiritimatiellia bacterium]